VIGRHWQRHVQDRPELSLHAIYIIDRDGKVFYRKVARRRSHPDELLDALDYHAGTYRSPTQFFAPGAAALRFTAP